MDCFFSGNVCVQKKRLEVTASRGVEGGAESAEGAAPRSPPASDVHDKGVEFEGIASPGVEGAGKRRRRWPPEPPGERND